MSMTDPTWTEILQAIGAISVPFVVAIVGFVLARSQNRNTELLKVRLDYYRLLAPGLNRLMCYMTFIGTWRDDSPPQIIEQKRQLDHTFFCAAPLFSPGVLKSYTALMTETFSTFNDWGEDAKIRSNPYRRRQSWRCGQPWDSAWDRLFAFDDAATISAQRLRNYRELYDALIGQMVKDLAVTRTRSKYTTDEVSLNAYAPARDDITGASNPSGPMVTGGSTENP